MVFRRLLATRSGLTCGPIREDLCSPPRTGHDDLQVPIELRQARCFRQSDDAGYTLAVADVSAWEMLLKQADERVW